MFNKCKTLVRNHSLKIASATAVIVSVPKNVLAVGVADTAVVTGITGIVDNVVATIASVAPICLTIFAAFIMWKYGKRIFNKLG